MLHSDQPNWPLDIYLCGLFIKALGTIVLSFELVLTHMIFWVLLAFHNMPIDSSVVEFLGFILFNI